MSDNQKIKQNYTGPRIVETYLLKKKRNISGPNKFIKRFCKFDLDEKSFSYRDSPDNPEIKKIHAGKDLKNFIGELEEEDIGLHPSKLGFYIITKEEKYTFFVEKKETFVKWNRLLNFHFTKKDIENPNLGSLMDMNQKIKDSQKYNFIQDDTNNSNFDIKAKNEQVNISNIFEDLPIQIKKSVTIGNDFKNERLTNPFLISNDDNGNVNLANSFVNKRIDTQKTNLIGDNNMKESFSLAKKSENTVKDSKNLESKNDVNDKKSNSLFPSGFMESIQKVANTQKPSVLKNPNSVIKNEENDSNEDLNDFGINSDSDNNNNNNYNNNNKSLGEKKQNNFLQNTNKVSSTKNTSLYNKQNQNKNINFEDENNLNKMKMGNNAFDLNSYNVTSFENKKRKNNFNQKSKNIYRSKSINSAVNFISEEMEYNEVLDNINENDKSNKNAIYNNNNNNPDDDWNEIEEKPSLFTIKTFNQENLNEKNAGKVTNKIDISGNWDFDNNNTRNNISNQNINVNFNENFNKSNNNKYKVKENDNNFVININKSENSKLNNIKNLENNNMDYKANSKLIQEDFDINKNKNKNNFNYHNLINNQNENKIKTSTVLNKGLRETNEEINLYHKQSQNLNNFENTINNQNENSFTDIKISKINHNPNNLIYDFTDNKEKIDISTLQKQQNVIKPIFKAEKNSYLNYNIKKNEEKLNEINNNYRSKSTNHFLDFNSDAENEKISSQKKNPKNLIEKKPIVNFKDLYNEQKDLSLINEANKIVKNFEQKKNIFTKDSKIFNEDWLMEKELPSAGKNNSVKISNKEIKKEYFHPEGDFPTKKKGLFDEMNLHIRVGGNNKRPGLENLHYGASIVHKETPFNDKVSIKKEKEKENLNEKTFLMHKINKLKVLEGKANALDLTSFLKMENNEEQIEFKKNIVQDKKDNFVFNFIVPEKFNKNPNEQNTDRIQMIKNKLENSSKANSVYLGKDKENKPKEKQIKKQITKTFTEIDSEGDEVEVTEIIDQIETIKLNNQLACEKSLLENPKAELDVTNLLIKNSKNLVGKSNYRKGIDKVNLKREVVYDEFHAKIGIGFKDDNKHTHQIDEFHIPHSFLQKNEVKLNLDNLNKENVKRDFIVNDNKNEVKNKEIKFEFNEGKDNKKFEKVNTFERNAIEDFGKFTTENFDAVKYRNEKDFKDIGIIGDDISAIDNRRNNISAINGEEPWDYSIIDNDFNLDISKLNNI